MVKNVGGGGNAKRQGRKFVNNKKHIDLRKSESPLEEYACVLKNHGNGLGIITHTGQELFCHMRGKFTGKNRRQNDITVGSWILVGMRDWEKEAKNCDLLAVYDRDEKSELRSLPGINLKILIKNTEKNLDDDEDDDYLDDVPGFEFKAVSVLGEEYKKILEQGNTEAAIGVSAATSATVEDESWIDIDDL